jgi:hypothetical protein
MVHRNGSLNQSRSARARFCARLLNAKKDTNKINRPEKMMFWGGILAVPAGNLASPRIRTFDFVDF